MITWIICIAVAVVLGLLAGLIIWKKYDRFDDALDARQTKLNRVENFFSRTGRNWMSEFLEILVVGDEEKIEGKIAELFEADDTVLFFLTGVAMPCTLFAIQVAAEKYPETYKKIKDAIAKEDIYLAAQRVQPVAPSPAAPSPIA